MTRVWYFTTTPDPLTGGPDDPTISYKNNIYAYVNRVIGEFFSSMNPHKNNRYVYCRNNPVNFIDPLGLDEEEDDARDQAADDLEGEDPPEQAERTTVETQKEDIKSQIDAIPDSQMSDSEKQALKERVDNMGVNEFKDFKRQWDRSAAKGVRQGSGGATDRPRNIIEEVKKQWTTWKEDDYRVLREVKEPGEMVALGGSGGFFGGIKISFDKVCIDGKEDWFFTLGAGFVTPGGAAVLDYGQSTAITKESYQAGGWSMSGDLVIVGGEIKQSWDTPEKQDTSYTGGMHLGTPGFNYMPYEWTWDIGN